MQNEESSATTKVKYVLFSYSSYREACTEADRMSFIHVSEHTVPYKNSAKHLIVHKAVRYSCKGGRAAGICSLTVDDFFFFF